MVEEVGRSYLYPAAPTPAPQLPALRFCGARQSCKLPSISKEKLALSSGHVKGGFLLLRREGAHRGGLTKLCCAKGFLGTGKSQLTTVLKCGA